MTRSIEIPTASAFDEPQYALLAGVPELYKAYADTFPERFADKGPNTYSMTFKGNFLSYTPEDQKIFMASLFAGTLVQELFQEKVAIKYRNGWRSNISGLYTQVDGGELLFKPREQDIDNGFSLSSDIAVFAQEAMANVGVTMDTTSAVVALSEYDKKAKERVLLTSNKTDIIIDPMMMLCDPNDLSPSGIFRPMGDQTLLREPRGTGVLYIGLDFKIRQFTLAR